MGHLFLQDIGDRGVKHLSTWRALALCSTFKVRTCSLPTLLVFKSWTSFGYPSQRSWLFMHEPGMWSAPILPLIMLQRLLRLAAMPRFSCAEAILECINGVYKSWRGVQFTRITIEWRRLIWLAFRSANLNMLAPLFDDLDDSDGNIWISWLL